MRRSGCALQDDLRLEGYDVDTHRRWPRSWIERARIRRIRSDPARRDAATDGMASTCAATFGGQAWTRPSSCSRHGLRRRTRCSVSSAGADDYVTKPYSPRELRARVRARRCARTTPPATVVGFGDCEFDLVRAELRRSGKVLSITPLELKILVHVRAAGTGRVLTRRTLIDEAWGRGLAITERVVDNQIANLRQKIEPVAGRSSVPQERSRPWLPIRFRGRDRIVTRRWPVRESSSIASGSEEIACHERMSG